MRSTGRTILLEDWEGLIALRDFPTGRTRVRRHLQEDRNRPVVAIPRQLMLSDNFSNLLPREQFFERRDLFHHLLTLYREHGFLRADLKAEKWMNDNSSCFKFEGLGPVPGVNVGDTFDYRAEMFVVGLHRALEAGIACVTWGEEKIASSIVVSSGYPDNVDYGDVIEYSGHGGNDEQRVGKKEDQKLENGNMGLFNSFKYRTVVRVSRRLKKESTFYKRFSYDGLYTVSRHDVVDGLNGYKVHKFRLVRQRGQ